MEENFLYELDGKKYNLPANEVDMFLEKFPNAKKIEETDFTNPTTPGAVVEGQSEVPNTDLKLDPGSSGSQNNPLGLPTFTLDEAKANTPKQPEGAVSENYIQSQERKRLFTTAKNIVSDEQRLRNALPDEYRGMEIGEMLEQGVDIASVIKKQAVTSYEGNTASGLFTFSKPKVYDNLNVKEEDFEDAINKYIAEAQGKEIKGKQSEKTKFVSEFEATGDYKASFELMKDVHEKELTGTSRKALQAGVERQRQLNELILNGSQSDKIQANTELEKLMPELDKLKNKVFGSDTKFFFDGNGQRIDAIKTDGDKDLTAEYNAELESQKKLANEDFEKLEHNYFYHLHEYKDNEDLLSQTIDFAPNGNNAAFQGMNLYNKGYEEYRKEDGTRVFKNVPLKELLQYSNQDDVTFKDASKDGPDGSIKLDVDNIFTDYKKNAARLNLEREAYGSTYLLNIDPGTRKKSIVTTAERFFESALESTIGKENAEKIGTTAVKELDEVQKILIEAGIQLTDTQKENFEKSFGLKAAENLGAFVPELAKFAIVNYATGGALSVTGGAKLLRALQTSKSFKSKATYHFLMAAMEEAKFEVVTGGEAKTGAGAGFYVGGALFRKYLPFQFKGSAARYNEGLQKTVGGAGGMVVGSESALLLEAVIEDVKGNQTFMNEMKDLFGEDADWVERFGLSAVTGFAIGGTSLKRVDFKSIKEREAIVNKARAENIKLQKEIDMELNPGAGPGFKANKDVNRESRIKENEKIIEQNNAKIFYLSKDIARANEAYNKLDLNVAQQKRDKAQGIINNPESTAKEVKAARIEKAEASAQIESAKNQIETTLANLKESKALGTFDYEVKEGKEGFSNPKNNAEFITKGPNGNPLIKIDLLSYKKGMQAHEVTHLLMKQLFKSNPEVANKLKYRVNELINEKLKGSNLPIGDIKKLEEAIDLTYQKKNQRGEEYIANLVEILQNPTYKRLLVEGEGSNLLVGIRNKFVSMLNNNKIKSGKTVLEGDNIRTAQDLVNFLGKFGKNVESGKDISKQVEGFKNLKIDGDVLYDLSPSKLTKDSGVKASKDLRVLEAETNIERQILKQRTGNFEGNKVLQDNINLQYNKIAMAALGFKLQKSFDAKTMGLKEAQFNDALSFVTQYKDGIIKRWKPEDGKFSTLVYGNIRPKQALFYEQAFGKNADVTGRITEKTKEIADTSVKTEAAPKLIEPLTKFAPQKSKEFEKQYESGLKNIDLSKQDYSTLKDVAPKVTNKIFGETFEAKKEFIKNNAEALYNILPLAFRRMAEGTKSSTKINPGVLKNFYVTGGRADMTVGTKAGLPIKAKIPWANASKNFLELFTGKKTGNDLRNQKTLVKGLQSEIGRAITNSVARRNPSHPENLIQKLSDGKADVLAARTLKVFEVVKNEFGGKIVKDAKTVQRISRSFNKIIRDIDGASFFIIPSNLAPGGNKITRMRDGSLFVSKALDKATLDAIKTKNALEVAALRKIKQELDLDIRPGTKKAPKWTIVIKSQKTQNLNKNLKEVGVFKENFKTGLDIIAEMYKVDAQATGLVVYNQNANGSSTRNMAQLRGIEIGAKKILEEHILQHGQFSKLVGVYSQLKNPIAKKDMSGWLAENYIQISLKSGTGKNRKDSHYLVDKTYDINGIKYKSKSELHPFLAEKIQQAIDGKISWKEVPSSNIRLYNEVVKLNPNKITQEGITHAKKYNVEVPKELENNKAVYERQAELIFDQLKGEISSKVAKQAIDVFVNARFPKIKKGIELVAKAKEADLKILNKQKEVFASKDLNKEFNNFLEKSTGIGAEKIFSDAKAAARGRKVRKDFGDYFIPPGAEDFGGLLHKTLAKGKQGEKQLEFYRKNLYDPYNLAVENITREQRALSNDFKALKDQLTTVPKKLKQYTKQGDFTFEQAVRVSVWNKLGYEIPGLTKTDRNQLIKEVKNNPELNTFANEILRITKGDGYAKPESSWVAGNIATDFVSLLNGTKRTKYLEVWKNNVDVLFSKDNLNKLEAAYGKNWVKNLTNTLQRMKTGSNRKWGGNATVEKWNDWVNGSVGAIMFLNTRSAVLQTISSVNYVNFTDNNPLQAAKAFGNQKQYWKDFKTIFNSDYLQNRRGGNKINVNESELALAQEKGGVQGVIALMLNKGFVFTRIADSFAIASGGSTMYRNRLNRYKKEGLSEKEAEAKAFLDFKKITEETQQSSRPDRISEQQAGTLGRFMLAFANTPMQYNRIIKRNAQDLIAGRGNKAEKMTRITYYTMVQNFIFNAMQKALFGLAFSDDKEKETEKIAGVANGMMDSLLRGSGLTGNAIVGVKAIAMDLADRMDRPRPNFQDAAWKALTISPPLYSKATKLRGAGYSLDRITKRNVFEPSLDNPALQAGAQFSSAAFNFPLDRALRKAQNIEAAMSDEAEYWQKVSLLLGWGEWELGMQDNKPKSSTKPKPSGNFTRSTYRPKKIRITNKRRK